MLVQISVASRSDSYELVSNQLSLVIVKIIENVGN